MSVTIKTPSPWVGKTITQECHNCGAEIAFEFGDLTRYNEINAFREQNIPTHWLICPYCGETIDIRIVKLID
jgi:hypothetical protein